MEQRSSTLLTSAAVLLAALLVAPLSGTGADGGMTRQPSGPQQQSPALLPSWSIEAARRHHHWSLPGSTTAGASMLSSPHQHGPASASRPPLPPPPSDVLRPPQPPMPSRVAPETAGAGSPDLQSTAGPSSRPPDQENEIAADGYYYLPRATSSLSARPSGEGEGVPRGSPAHPAAGRPSAGPRPRPQDVRRARLEEQTLREDIAQRRSGKAETEPAEEEVTRKKAPGQANPDIQDIISGIVRLLGGNVNVQANAGTTTTTPIPLSLPSAPGGMRPPPPPSHHVRINNRGPPRITDILFEEDSRPPQRPPRPPPPPQFQPPMKPLVTARPQGTMAVPTSGKPGPERPPYPFERPLEAVPRPPPGAQQNKLKPSRQMPRPFATKPAADHQPKLTSVLKSSSVTKSSQVKVTTAPGRVTASRPKPTQSSVPRVVTSSSKVTKQPTTTSTSKASSSGSKTVSSTSGSKVSVAATTGVVTGTSSSGKPQQTSTAKVSLTSTTETLPMAAGSSSGVTRVEPTKVEDKSTSSSSTAISPSKTSSPAGEVTATTSILGISTSSSSSEHTIPKEKEEVHSVHRETSTPPLTSVVSSASSLEPSIQEPSILATVEEASGLATQRPTPPITLSPATVASSSSSTDAADTPLVPSDRWPHLPRPGIVLDDTEYKPGLATEGDILTAAPPHRVNGGHGEVFDVTVSAIQGPGGNTGRPFVYPVDVDGVQLSGGDDVITGEPGGNHDFVSIDGKRTYIDLFPTRKQPGKGETVVHTVGTNLGFPQSPPANHYGTAHPEPVNNLGEGTGYAVPEVSSSSQTAAEQKPKHPSPNVVRRPPNRRPSHPPVRIDTCIVGDPSTCDQSQHESCRTEQGVSSCHCRPGYARRKHREPCRGIISVMVAMKVGRVYDQLSPWTDSLIDPNSDDYLQMEWEANKAIDSAMSMTPYSDDFLGSRINGFKKASGNDGNSNVIINATLEIVDGGGPLDSDRLHNHLMGVVRRRRNNIGDSALWVESPDGAFSPIMDVDECSQPELNDCSSGAECTNLYGSFRCRCKDGLRDPALPYGVLPGQPVTPQEERRIGRRCEACSAQAHCMSRGTCTFGKTGEVMCSCTGNFYGAQCEVDGEVVGVAVGASVAAIVIIVLTLVCLCMWSRRWNKQDSQAQQEVQKKHHLAAMTGIRGVIGSGPLGTNRGMMSPPPIFAYLPGGGTMISGHKGSVPTLSSSGPSSLPPPPPAYYPLSSEDRMRWAQINEAVVSQQNHYAQPEPVPLPTRPSSAIFGAYGNGTIGSMATLPHHGTLGSMTALRHIPGGGNMLGLGPGMFPTAPHMRPHQVVAPSSRSVFGSKSVDAAESSDEDEDVVGEDHHKDLLGRSFHVPRPKSRSSIANQSGIYYDVDYEQSDPYGRVGPSSLPKQPPQPPIPMSTYTPGLNRHYFK